jgi:hypothetical protein
MSEAGELLLRLLEEAANGDARAALGAAVLIHRNSITAKELQVSANYEGLLIKALQSSDAELLAVAAEEIIVGKNLVGDRLLLKRFLEKAERIDRRFPYYIAARLLQRSRSAACGGAFRKAGRAGHIPSLIMARKMFLEKYWVLRPVVWPIFLLMNFISVRTALNSADRYERFWRYKDVLISPTPALDSAIGVDRRVSISEFTP